MPCRSAETSGMEVEAETSSEMPVPTTERYHIPQTGSTNDINNEALTQYMCVYMQTQTQPTQRYHE